ncbi:hypothetical protein BDQ17DRAFT_1400984 [Cyathus striatus]|nr:hypothetical protein BDQ17DRAFT_1400984 [Cyathus striatus]
MITFYDAPANIPNKCGSLSTWKTRYCLNYKVLPYQTKWIEYTEIEPLFKELGIPPTGTKPDGSPYYTIPAIYDDATGAKVADSMKIAAYLDKTYPSEKQVLIPPGTEVLHYAFRDAVFGILSSLWPLYVPHIPGKLNPASREYFKRTRARLFKVDNLEDMRPKGDEAFQESLKKLEDGLGRIYGWIYSVGDEPFIGGNSPIFADFIVASALVTVKYTWGEDSVEWKALRSWHGGRWEKLVDDLKEYETEN